jgi:hypothetical protein
MSVTGRNRVFYRLVGALGVAAGLCVVITGCTRTPSSAERLKAAYESSGLKPITVYPFAGTVTVDNSPPNFKKRKTSIIVMAYDPSKPDAPIKQNTSVTTQADGSFEFPDGGLPPGKYVMLFAELHLQKKQGWQGPDDLKNLYNDPSVNGKKKEFQIDHQEPGKKDYNFNLNVAGETPPAQHGPKALVELPN